MAPRLTPEEEEDSFTENVSTVSRATSFVMLNSISIIRGPVGWKMMTEEMPSAEWTMSV